MTDATWVGRDKSIGLGLSACAVAVCSALLLAAAGHAAYPGRNGWIVEKGYVFKPGSQEYWKLPTVHGVESEPEPQRAVWSRDGRRLLISTFSAIYVTDATGRRLPAFPVFRRQSDPTAAWSRDGSAIVYRKAKPHCGSGALVVYRFRDRTTTQITPCDGATLPAWSPSGPYIAYRGIDGSVRLVDTVHQTIQTINAPPASLAGGGMWPYAGAPSWSPDGHEVAFSDGYSIVAYNVTSGQTRTLIPPDADPAVPMGSVAWSPDGNQIAYTRDAIQRETLYIANADGSNAHPSFNYGCGCDVGPPDWQPTLG